MRAPKPQNIQWYLLVLKKYGIFKGRARRKEYWYFTLFSIIISIVSTLLDEQLNSEYLESFYSLAVLVPSIAVGVRRMHDINKSGWYSLISIYNLILACTEGTEGMNNYESDPKRPEIWDEIDQIGSNQD